MFSFDIPDNGEYAPLTVRIVESGERHGLTDSLVNTTGAALVEFYDRRYKHTKYGQFISSYNVGTVMSDDLNGRGIDLDGGVESWTVTPSALSYEQYVIASRSEHLCGTVGVGKLLTAAHGLLGDEGTWSGNPEYTRAVIELVSDALNIPEEGRDRTAELIRNAHPALVTR